MVKVMIMVRARVTVTGRLRVRVRARVRLKLRCRHAVINRRVKKKTIPLDKRKSMSHWRARSCLLDELLIRVRGRGRGRVGLG